MRQDTVGIDEKYDELLPIPVLSVTAELTPLENLSVFANARGIIARSEWLGLDDDVQGESRFFNVWAGVRGRLSFLTGTLGYKWILLDAGIDEASADIDFQGVFVTLGFEF